MMRDMTRSAANGCERRRMRAKENVGLGPKPDMRFARGGLQGTAFVTLFAQSRSRPRDPVRILLK